MKEPPGNRLLDHLPFLLPQLLSGPYLLRPQGGCLRQGEGDEERKEGKAEGGRGRKERGRKETRPNKEGKKEKEAEGKDLYPSPDSPFHLPILPPISRFSPPSPDSPSHFNSPFRF